MTISSRMSFIPKPILDVIADYVGPDIVTSFIRKHGHLLPLKDLCRNPNAPLGYILENKKDIIKKRFSISHFCSRDDIPLDFLREMVKYLRWEKVFRNEFVPRDFIMENKDKGDGELTTHYSWPGHTQEFLIDAITNKLTETNIVDGCLENPGLFSGPIENVQKIVEEIIKRSKIAAMCISSNTSVPLSFLKANPTFVEWDYLFENSGRPLRDPGALEFLEDNIDQIKATSYNNPAIPLEFLVRHPERIDWDVVGFNTSLPFSFFKENIARRGHNMWLDSLGNPNIPFDFHLDQSEKGDMRLCKAYNIPIDEMEKRIKSRFYYGSDIALNGGIWPRVAKYELIPILVELFG